MSDTKQTINKAWQECYSEANDELFALDKWDEVDVYQLAAEKYAVRFGKYLLSFIDDDTKLSAYHKDFIEENNK